MISRDAAVVRIKQIRIELDSLSDLILQIDTELEMLERDLVPTPEEVWESVYREEDHLDQVASARADQVRDIQYRESMRS